MFVCVIQRERQTRHERRHVERGREREKLQVGERLLQFSSCLLGMSWLRISQNDLLGEKRREMGRRGARKREKGMKCHWGIPLSSPVLPPLSRAVHFIPLCLCPSLLPLLTFFPPQISMKILSSVCNLLPGSLLLSFVSSVSGGVQISSASLSISVTSRRL